MATQNGFPWQQQYDFNTSQSGEITDWEVTTTANPSSLSGQSQSIVAFGFVFIFHGNLANCRRAPINTDGTIGSWTSVSTGIASNFNSAEFILAGDKLYCIGGIDDSSGHAESSTTVQYATIGTDGSIGSWTTASSLPSGRRFGRTIIVSGRLYYIGGQQIRYLVQYSSFVEDSKAEVFYADLNSNNVIGTWSTSANSLPQGRGKACVALAGERIYLQGGEYNSNKRYQIYYADISGNSIGSWSTDLTYENTNMQHSNACCVVTNSTLYVIGGESSSGGGGNKREVYWIPFNEIGEFESPGWSSAEFLPFPAGISYATAVVTSAYVHIIGGLDNSGWAPYILSAPFDGGSNSYEAFILADGAQEQEEPSAASSGNAHRGAIGNIEQDEAQVSGSAFAAEYASEGTSVVEQPEPLVSGFGSGSSASIGITEQSEAEVGGTASGYIVCFGSAKAYLPGNRGVAYTGSFFSDGVNIQPVPLVSGNASTWNIGSGVVAQFVPVMSGLAANSLYRWATGGAAQNVPLVNGSAASSIVAIGNSTQSIKVVFGRSVSTSLCVGNVIQPIHKITGKVLRTNIQSTLSFDGYSHDLVPIGDVFAPTPLEFPKPVIGSKPTIDVNSPTALSFSR